VHVEVQIGEVQDLEAIEGWGQVQDVDLVMA
jgi:hypothetical protein